MNGMSLLGLLGNFCRTAESRRLKMANPPKLTAIPGGMGGSAGSGPEDSMLEQRVARLEEDMKEVKSSLKGIQESLTQIAISIAKLDGRMTGLEGRLQAIPSAWQLFVALITTWSAGAAIVFAMIRFAPK
jgi:uncharacterized coiled-coil protein SlyX